MNKIRALARQAWKSLCNDDSSDYPNAQSTYSKKPTAHVRLSTYGICANAPKDSHVFLFQSKGQESIKFGIENDFLRRLKGLTEGEAALYNTLTKSFVLMKADGSVEVDSKKDIIATAEGDVTVTATGDINATAATATVTAATVTINGNLVVNGTITGATAITSSGTVTGASIASTAVGVPFETHTHVGASGGPI